LDITVFADARLELQLVGAAVILGLIQLLIGSVAARSQQGYEWGMGSRDEPAPISGVPARLQRAFYNYLESLPLFAAAMLAAVMLGNTGQLTAIGGIVFLIARIVFVPLYAAGVFLWRTLAWIVATAGLTAVIAAIFV